ncbi:hypothetical protein COH20_006332 [Aspergillus flavus]|uniref:EF-hand domain-containing protein n=1 Tax=Aspergillus flavus TaxID=5059 RepID=A0AB74CRF5_ASPFL|nr:hypothetical protein NYO67_7939 [Aspergillus flavus]QMW45301.1 hypothetical protein G4B11_008721 [Aspergillus flavus]RAQ69408.1 hypothetical protein COH20_006332 [Aspergillus flavus]RAQ74034.1 hypothetical protein COH21_000032 [Aspergillus flavus]RMZ48577.1 hypothetical protein CA14_009343 [Aspergillus flavus]
MGLSSEQMQGWKELFKDINTGHSKKDRTIDFEEFDKFVKKNPELGIENARERFDEIDDNENGSISLSEFVDGFGKLVRDREVKRAFYEEHNLVDPES